MSDTNAIKNLDSRVFSVTCRRCNHVYNDEDHQPRLLPCLHDVCLDCLCELVFDEILNCPECKSAHETSENDVTLFPKDPVKMRYIAENTQTQTEVYCDFCDQEPKATHRCMDCLDNLCSECLQIHQKYKKYRDHGIVSLKEYANLQQHYVMSSSKCKAPGHSNERLKFFCSNKSCERCLCSLCVIPHIEDNHKVKTIESVFETRLKNIKTIEAVLQHQSDGVDDTITLIRDEISNVDRLSEEALGDADFTFNLLMKQLERRKSEVKTFIQSKQKNKRALLMEQERKFQMHKNVIEDGRSYLKNILESGNKPEFINLERIIREQFLKLTDQDNRCLPCINSTVRFSSQNMLEELKERIDIFGTTVFSNAYAPYTKMYIPSLAHVEETIEIRIELFDQHQVGIEEEEMDVQVCLVDPSGKVTRSLCPCEREDGGLLKTQFRVDVTGIYSVEVFIHGRPFYTHSQQLDIIERPLSPDDGVQCIDIMKSPIPDLVLSQDDMKPLTSPRKPINSGSSGLERYRMTYTCPPFHLDESTLHKNCYISRNKLIISNTSTAVSQYQTTLINKGSVYNGIAGSIWFFSPCAAYFEVEIKYDIWEDLSFSDVICDVIITNLEMSDFTSPTRHHKFGWSFSVLFCEKCHQVCIECWDHGHLVSHLPVGLVYRKSSLRKVIGIFVDDTNGCISIVDTTESDLIVRFDDVMFEKPLWPAFCLHPSGKFTVELKIRTGQQINKIPSHLLPV
ncbi:E3 ubiquitin-protein ligase TRIM23-like [Saccostrea echinata]|uniref:E3 ubiquitin-protein ligase TRIM23-like n=1 Tax=Saccostrea echinata TaxID=191078 RepID=UPI002A7EE874|nr:E3 ubiquitin-protein ligase TRIM23-like [Saccostrea echinata]